MSNQLNDPLGLIRALPAMLFISNSEGMILSASNAFCATVGLAPDNVIGRSCHELFFVCDQAALKDAIFNGIIDRQPYIITLTNNSVMNVEVSCQQTVFGSVSEARIVILVDVSSHHNSYRELAIRNSRLEEDNENLNRFAFNASHDLQDPARKIRQFSSLLEQELIGDTREDTRYQLKVITDAADRLSKMIRELHSFSEISQRKTIYEKISLNNLMENVLAALSEPLRDSDGKITVEKLPTVTGDTSLVRQMLLILINSSIKDRAGDRELKITISALGPDLSEGIRFVDNGIGFDTQFAADIFAPFSSPYKGRQSDGLELPICKAICDEHGWSILAESEAGNGKTIQIKF